MQSQLQNSGALGQIELKVKMSIKITKKTTFFQTNPIDERSKTRKKPTKHKGHQNTIPVTNQSTTI